MNADDRATTPPKGLFTPREPDAPIPAAERDEAPRVPQRSAFRPVTAPVTTPAAPTGAATGATPRVEPTSPASSTPHTSNFQWPGVGTAAPAGSSASDHVSAPPAPVTGPKTSPTTSPATPSSAPSGPVSAPAAPVVPGAFSVGVDRVKGFALKAREALTEGDDLAASTRKGGPRRARVLVSRIDPWSVLKIGFLLSIAAGIMAVVAVFVIWNVLNQFGLFVLINEWIAKLFDGQQKVNLEQILQLNKVMSATVLISIVNVVLLTALSTIGAFLYNTVSSVVGGVYFTLTDD